MHLVRHHKLSFQWEPHRIIAPYGIVRNSKYIVPPGKNIIHSDLGSQFIPYTHLWHELIPFEQKWKTEEVMTGDLGHFSKLKLKTDHLSPVDRVNIQYYAEVMKILLYLSKAPVADIFTDGPQFTPEHMKMASTSHLGLEVGLCSYAFMTPMGYFRRNGIIPSGMIPKFAMVPSGPYHSLLRGLRGQQYEPIKFIPHGPWRDPKDSWNHLREHVFQRVREDLLRSNSSLEKTNSPVTLEK